MKDIKVIKIDDCWNKIGIAGDKSCPELKEFIHCRNCKNFERARFGLFKKELPLDYQREWTKHLSFKKDEGIMDKLVLLVFRIGKEWFGLQPQAIKEVTGSASLHSIPHRTDNVLKGFVNIHGITQMCISLSEFLELDKIEKKETDKSDKIFKRMIVMEWENDRWAFTVDEISGIHVFQISRQKKVPETLAKASGNYAKSIFELDNKDVGYLDHELIFNSLKRNVL